MHWYRIDILSADMQSPGIKIGIGKGKMVSEQRHPVIDAKKNLHKLTALIQNVGQLLPFLRFPYSADQRSVYAAAFYFMQSLAHTQHH